MYTDVLRVQQPHYFPTSLINRRCGETFDLSPDSRIHKVSYAKSDHRMQNASFRQRLQQTQQFTANPISSFLPAFASTVDCKPPNVENSEHMLRRKTPNGTIPAGYDGRSTDSAARSHATKHILMSTSNPADSTRYPEVQLPEHRFVPTLDEDYSRQNLNDDQDRYVNTVYHTPRDLYNNVDRGKDIGRANEKRSQSFYDASVDSVLNQGQAPQQSQIYSNIHAVPTVLQPMWPPCLGFTSMNRTGPYGPYWPDGAFEPYRPAAVRDSRYDHQLQDNATDLPYHIGPEAPQNQGWSQYAPAYQRSLSGGQLPSYRSEENSRRLSSFRAQDHSWSDQWRVSDYSQSRPLRYEESSTCNSWGSWNQDAGEPDSMGVLVENHMEPRSRKDHAQFKERVLVWAHQTYMNLLTSIHQSRHNGSAVHVRDERKLHSSIFPKPPGVSSVHLACGTGPEAHIEPSLTTQPAQAHIADCNSSLSRSSNVSNSRSILADKSFAYQSRDAWGRHSTKRQLRKQQHEYQHTRGGRYRSRNSQEPSDESNTQWPQHEKELTASFEIGAIPSPLTTALSALEILGKLGHESGWQWTEGMLLGGCLAYGLGDHARAMKWYSKVLACDPNNVEALSNLAATCLSLNRREEAERYWRQSVALRPNFFEAVEHLVGLFCEDRRGREAVKIIDFVQRALQTGTAPHVFRSSDCSLDSASEGSLSPDTGISERSDFEASDCEAYRNRKQRRLHSGCSSSDSSGYAIPAVENGRMLALIHGKGNMLYALGDNVGAAKAFEDAILIGFGQRRLGIRGLIRKVVRVFTGTRRQMSRASPTLDEPILLVPEEALRTASMVFPPAGQLPGLANVASGAPEKAAYSIISNSLLSLAKIYQDGMSSSTATASGPRATSGVQDILALYYLSLSLQPSPSTANNVGILLASVQQATPSFRIAEVSKAGLSSVPGVVPGSGIALALAYYNFGLRLDPRHAHLYTNLGSLFKDIGQLDAAIKMYEKAVACDGKFDIALANLANAVKDRGRIGDAISYYRQAVALNPDFAEAVCGLANALNSVCSWSGRGGVKFPGATRYRWHVDDHGMLYDAKHLQVGSSGWIGRVVTIVDKQLQEGESWGKGVLLEFDIQQMIRQLVSTASDSQEMSSQDVSLVRRALFEWSQQPWEGAKLVRLIERATKRLAWHFYRSKHIYRQRCRLADYPRPQLPPTLAIPSAPTVLPFHTFTCPLTAKQIRRISQRNGLRISCSTLRAPWLPKTIYEPPAPPQPHLNVGYVSSDFNNHPLAHLMQSVFGLHDTQRVKAFCYATTASDGSLHRRQIEREAPVFEDVSSWSVDRLVDRIVGDRIHILINLNGYTRGARNELFAARSAPIQMSFMGFAGTLGAEWCDYLLADQIAIPSQTLRPNRSNVDLLDQTKDGNNEDDEEHWVYGENIIFTRDTFFCCDHRQSAPDAKGPPLCWEDEQRRRWKMRKDLFPNISDDTIILGNFNQLYKIEPTTFRTWLRILARLPNCILWLLRFPDVGESNLKQTARQWVGAEVASRIVFTDVAPKSQHIARARICDLFLDTPECNAHTTAADVLWSGTPMLTLPRYEYKMCSRMAASILTGALPKNAQGEQAARQLIAKSEEEYEDRAVELGAGLIYPTGSTNVGFGQGRLVELRKLLYESRDSSALFDTRRWVGDLEDAYEEAWRRWVEGIGGDIWL